MVCAGEPVKFAFIADLADDSERKPRGEIFPVTFMCEMLGVTPGGYYAWKKRGPSKRSLDDAELGVLIAEIHVANEGRYGVHSRGAVIWCQVSAGSGGSQGFPASAPEMASSVLTPWAAAESR